MVVVSPDRWCKINTIAPTISLTHQPTKIIIIKALMNNSTLVPGLTFEMTRTIQLPTSTTNQKTIGIFLFLAEKQEGSNAVIIH